MAAHFIETIFTITGNDQMGAMYSLFFPKGIPGTSSALPLEFTFRADKEFEIPEKKVMMKDIYYRGIKIPKRIPKDETDKRFTINFRLDENFRIYDSLQQWLDRVYNPQYGNTNTGKLTLRSLIKGEQILKTTLVFQAFKSDKKIGKKIEFKGLCIESLKLTGFANDSGDPARVEAVFHYQTRIDKKLSLLSFI
jgi:hypothetical protein